MRVYYFQTTSHGINEHVTIMNNLGSMETHSFVQGHVSALLCSDCSVVFCMLCCLCLYDCVLTVLLFSVCFVVSVGFFSLCFVVFSLFCCFCLFCYFLSACFYLNVLLFSICFVVFCQFCCVLSALLFSAM